MIDRAGIKNLLYVNMLGGAGTKKVLSTEDVRLGWYKKPPLRQYVSWGWHKQDLFTETFKRGLYKKVS